VLKSLQQRSGPHLIVVPVSLLENWQRELLRWCPALRVLPFYGARRTETRRRALRWAPPARLPAHVRAGMLPAAAAATCVGEACTWQPSGCRGPSAGGLTPPRPGPPAPRPGRWLHVSQGGDPNEVLPGEGSEDDEEIEEEEGEEEEASGDGEYRPEPEQQQQQQQQEQKMRNQQQREAQAQEGKGEGEGQQQGGQQRQVQQGGGEGGEGQAAEVYFEVGEPSATLLPPPLLPPLGARVRRVLPGSQRRAAAQLI
jgi:hypothetical protein